MDVASIIIERDRFIFRQFGLGEGKWAPILAVFLSKYSISVLNNCIKPNHWTGSHWARLDRKILLVNHW